MEECIGKDVWKRSYSLLSTDFILSNYLLHEETHDMKDNLREADSYVGDYSVLRLALSFPQTSMTDPYLKAVHCIPFLHTLVLKVHFNIISWSSLSYPKRSYLFCPHESSHKEGRFKGNTLHLCSGSVQLDYQPWYRLYSWKIRRLPRPFRTNVVILLYMCDCI
jgi:hypothetical protein